jgi:hypothetical protein
MRSRLLFPAAAVAAAATAAMLGSPASGAASRQCTSDDLAGTRAPAMLDDHGLDTQPDPLIVGTRYRVVVVQELAIGDNGRPVDGSISITAPNGPALAPTSENDRPAYDFVPEQAGSVRLVVSWEEEVGSPGSGDVCSASQTFDIPVVAPTKPRIEGRFSRGPHTFDSYFLLKLRGKRPQDPAKVTVTLRGRRGSTKPPPARGRGLGRFVFTPGFGHFATSSNDRRLPHTFSAFTVGGGVRIDPYNNIAFGRTLRFAFSLEVTQRGKRLGGMRSGAVCRRIQFPGHSAVKCRAVGFRLAP